MYLMRRGGLVLFLFGRSFSVMLSFDMDCDMFCCCCLCCFDCASCWWMVLLDADWASFAICYL